MTKCTALHTFMHRRAWQTHTGRTSMATTWKCFSSGGHQDFFSICVLLCPGQGSQKNPFLPFSSQQTFLKNRFLWELWLDKYPYYLPLSGCSTDLGQIPAAASRPPCDPNKKFRSWCGIGTTFGHRTGQHIDIEWEMAHRALPTMQKEEKSGTCKRLGGLVRTRW